MTVVKDDWQHAIVVVLRSGASIRVAWRLREDDAYWIARRLREHLREARVRR